MVTDSMYTDLLHGIAERSCDTVTAAGVPNIAMCNVNNGDVIDRTTRISLTIRHVHKTLKVKLKF